MSVDSFEDDVVVELPDENAVTNEDIENNPSEDTFDNNVYRDVSKDKQTNMLEDQDDKDVKTPKEGERDKENNEDKEGKDTPEEPRDGEKKEERKETEEDGPKRKPIKLKDGEKDVEISPDATVKVKVKGKNEFVSIEELKSDYSGRQAWTEKIETANEKLREADFRESAYKEERQELVGHLEKIAGLIDKEEGDPLEALYYLLDMTGRDVNTYSKRVFDFMEDQVHAMSSMDDVEKELHWTRKKLDAINNNQAAKSASLAKENAHRDFVSRVDKMRESHGVSEEQYVQAHNELLGLGFKSEKVTPELVVNYSAVKPSIEKAERLVSQFEDDLGTDDMEALISETASAIRKYPRISEEEALSFAAKGLGFSVETIEDDIDKLNDKIGNRDDAGQSTNMKYKSKDAPGHVESFDDYDY